jgi:hypothetical protein
MADGITVNHTVMTVVVEGKALSIETAESASIVEEEEEEKETD